MKKVLLLFLIVSSLMSCVSAKKMKEAFDPWIGRDINTLINTWGPPTKTYVLPNGKQTIYTWIYDGGAVVSTYQFENYGYSSLSQSRCEFNWTVNNYSRVMSYTYKGTCGISKKK